MASEKPGSLRTPTTPRVLAERYRLLERIDEGGAGEVWRARDEKLGRDVAVKVLGADADDAFRARFADEARRAAAVVHPNVVTVFDDGRDGADAFMVMELVPGKTLRDIVAERGPLPSREVSRLVSQVAAALDAAHAAGVIHCDVKPANVIVDPSGVAKLTDFGIARAARDRDEQELLGTARYIAPERIEGGPVTPRTDVYGLGLLAYELLAGRPAFDGTSNEELVRERLQGPPPSLRSVRLGVDDGIAVVVERALSSDPDRRHASAGAFGRAFADVAEQGDRTSSLAAIGLPRAARRWRLPRFDSTVAILAVVAILIALVLFFRSFPQALPATQQTQATPTAAANLTPDVVGRNFNDAGRVLTAAGFHAPIPWQVDPAARGQPCSVARQEPPPQTAFTRGANARLFLVGGKDCGGRGDDDD
jgi:serine/threonine-protein kinase